MDTVASFHATKHVQDTQATNVKQVDAVVVVIAAIAITVTRNLLQELTHPYPMDVV